MTLLSVKNLSVSFMQQGRSVLAANNISFALEAGQTLALIGESGSGKSVTALAIQRLLAKNADVSGESWFEGQNTQSLSETQLQQLRGRRIGMVFQEPMTSLNPLHPIEQQIAETLLLHQGLSASAARQRCLELLDMVGLPQASQRLAAYPHELSGGQRQRIMIAMALANNPSLLIADEPTTALDVTIQAQILTLLKNLQQQLNLALLLISHDLGIVQRMAQKIVVLKNGQIVEQASTTELFNSPQHDYTKHLLNTVPQGSAPAIAADAPELLQCQNLKVHFPIKGGWLRRTTATIKAVDGVSLKLHAGETLGIVGESGSGKTTLGLALLRLVASDGPIVFMGQNLQGQSFAALRPLRQKMQIVFQDPYGALSPRMCVGDIIAEGLDIHNLADAQLRREKINQALSEVGLVPDMASRFPHEFSGGQRQRIAIARALILQPALLVLDEPTSALDVSVQAQIVELLRGLQQKYGMAYIFISHDLRVVRAMAHQVIVMKNGLVVEHGSAEAIFHQPQQPYTQQLLAAALNLTEVAV